MGTGIADSGADARVDASYRAPDASDDAAMGAGYIGDPCATVAECRRYPNARCEAWPGGYCTAPCGELGACDDGTCVRLIGARPFCARACEQDRECREGYVCALDVEWRVCVPAELAPKD